MSMKPAAMARDDRKGGAAGKQYDDNADNHGQQGQDRSKSEGYSDEDNHAVAAAEAGKDGFPVAGDSGSPGQDEGAVGNPQETGKLDGQKAFYGVAGKYEYAVAPADIPENVGRAGAGAAGGKDVDAPAPGK